MLLETIVVDLYVLVSVCILDFSEMPGGKLRSDASSASGSDQNLMFPKAILANLAPAFTEYATLSVKVEEYLNQLVGHLMVLKAQNRIIRESIIAIPGVGSSNAGTVTTRDACRAIRSFSGIPVPDISSITRVPTAEPSHLTINPVTVGDPAAPSPSTRALNDEDLMSATGGSLGVGVQRAGAGKRRQTVSLASQLPKVPKKRGRPRKVDKPPS